MLSKSQQSHIRGFVQKTKNDLKKIDVIKKSADKLDTNIEIFIINLKRRPERLKLILDQLGKNGIHQFNIIEATDGKLISKENISTFIDNDFAKCCFGQNRLENAEIGCSDSHNRIYQEVLKRNLSHALVLEDDCILSDRFSQFWNDLKNEKEIELDVLLLGYWSPSINTKKLNFSIGGANVSEFMNMSFVRNPVWGTYGYLISYWGCMKMLACNNKIKFVADMPWNYFKQNFELFGLTNPVCFSEVGSIDSDIDVRSSLAYWIDAFNISHY